MEDLEILLKCLSYLSYLNVGVKLNRFFFFCKLSFSFLHPVYTAVLSSVLNNVCLNPFVTLTYILTTNMQSFIWPIYLQSDVFHLSPRTAIFKDLYDKFSVSTQRAIYKWITLGLQKWTKSNGNSFSVCLQRFYWGAGKNPWLFHEGLL